MSRVSCTVVPLPTLLYSGPYLLHDHLCRLAHRCHGVRGKEKHGHTPNQAANKNFWDCKIHTLEFHAGVEGDFVQESGKQQKTGQGRRANGVALRVRLGHVTDSVEPVRDRPHVLGLLGPG